MFGNIPKFIKTEETLMCSGFGVLFILNQKIHLQHNFARQAPIRLQIKSKLIHIFRFGLKQPCRYSFLSVLDGAGSSAWPVSMTSDAIVNCECYRNPGAFNEQNYFTGTPSLFHWSTLEQAYSQDL